MIEGLRQRLGRPVDAASLAAFRVMFGLMVALSAARFLAYGWVDLFFVRPSFHFHYLGFEWVESLGRGPMHALFAGFVALGLCIAVGLYTRVAAAAFFLAFTYVQLIDVATYLNHYVLVSLLALLLAVLPTGSACSIDAWRRPARASATVPAWCLVLLRAQVGAVYVFAGLAKVSVDWLVHAQPLSIWLASRTHVPLLGPIFAHPEAAWAMSWAGCLFDLTIVAWLSLRRTRAPAYAVLVAFHVLVGILFPIGMFPVIMIVGATVFFDPSWPRSVARWFRRADAVPTPERAAGSAPVRASVRAPSRWALAAMGAWAAAQVLVPLRAHLYGGDVHWHEQGMRWSWRVMVREKNASVTYVVRDPASGRAWEVAPRAHLERWQEREASTQPDLVLQLGQHIGREEARRLGRPVEVRVDAVASLNGRRRARMIDPGVDLMTLQGTFGSAPWILPPPPSAPPTRLASR